MTKVLWNYQTASAQVRGFKHLWLKSVVGFRPEVHCARCLVGSYDRSFGLKMPPNTDTGAEYDEGALLYFCGVSQPTRWERNFHFAGRVLYTAPPALHQLWNGDSLSVQGIEGIRLDHTIAAKAYPLRAPEFLQCRNFQFGAQMFAASCSLMSD